MVGMSAAPRAQQATPPESASASAPASPQDTPDDSLLEFLGADDVGDADWWEFFKKAPPRGDSPPASPPRDAKQ